MGYTNICKARPARRALVEIAQGGLTRYEYPDIERAKCEGFSYSRDLDRDRLKVVASRSGG